MNDDYACPVCGHVGVCRSQNGRFSTRHPQWPYRIGDRVRLGEWTTRVSRIVYWPVSRDFTVALGADWVHPGEFPPVIPVDALTPA